ncbi:helix-turn-helix domain-containing protein [Streptomyces olivoreticuli]|uniref:helix-turn-helix domain-containing protein n=1 Tax=Streptomyces olivoreticuli TaxID=68246 RepID=UPI000E27ED84|nr:helix-turn-helix transcriptional regulator [Streptomyces olivoreticuli]
MAGKTNSRLARLRQAAGYTQESFVAAFTQEATRLGLDASVSVRQLRRWEREEPPPLPHPSQQIVLEAMFGVPLVELEFDVPRHRVTVSAPISDAGDVKRRRFVADTGALAVAALVPAMPGPRVGTADIGRLRSQLDGLYRTDHATGSVPAMTQARRLEGEITQALGAASYTCRIGHELRTMLAELYGHRAWYGYDGGRIDEGRAACMEALAAAQLVDNPLLQVSVLETLVLLAIKADRTWEAASAVENAYRLATRVGAGPAVHLVIALRDANVATHAGDLAGTRRALSRAVSHQGRTDCDTDVPNWAQFVGPFEVDYATADMYVRAEQPNRAVPFLRAAVNGIGGELVRNSVSYRVKLAGVLLAAGEADEACAEMNRVLDTCGGISSPRLLEKIREFHRAATHVDSTATRDCAVRIRETMQRGTS